MKPMIRMGGLVSELAAALFLTACASLRSSEETQTPYAWKDSRIGVPAPSGSHVWDGNALKVSGAGAGLNVKGNDDCHFVYLTREPGDFEVVARLADFSGEGDAAAGIMARGDNTSTGTMAALFFKAKDNSADWMSRAPGASPREAPRVFSAGIPLAQKPPLWLRMVRIGKNFAVYKSRDGRLWSMISNVSGGPVALDGPLELGFFVSSAAGDKVVTATFDSIRIGAARMRYKTSWVGNTYGCRAEDNHVSNALSAMWVAPDGTCYASSYWDEAGQPVTSYRNGKVVRGLPIGTPQTAEGGITGDSRHLYVATVDRITELDPTAPDFAPRSLYLAVSLLDKNASRSVVSGLASNGRELFVADSRDNCVRVVQPDLRTYFSAGNTTVNMTTTNIDTAGVVHAAPALVYQSQRETDCTPYDISGLSPGGRYTVRCHFAEYTEDKPGKRLINIRASGATPVMGFDVVAEAGGKLRAAAAELPNARADASGKLTVVFERGAGGNGHIVICGFEVLGPDGAPAFALNCGGPAVEGFASETHEVPERRFAFERPGPMTIDKRGDLWITQRGNDFPIGGALTAKYPAAIKCYRTDGTFTGRAITDVVNPRALGYDAAKDQLLVAENGPDVNVRFYSGLETAPVLARTFGAKGGIFSGRHPGMVNDPAAGGYARFAGISGVGVDAQGNLYVGGGFQGTDLRMFAPDGKLGWMLNSLMFCNTYDVDPASDGSEIYGTYNHLHLDLSRTAPGTEQKFVGYNWDLRNFGEPVRAGSSQAIVRRLGADRRLVMFSSGQGTVGDINIFRYDGEIAIPAGGTRNQGSALWIDANGNGTAEPEEIAKMDSSIGWITGLCVDSRGDIWAATATTGGSFMRHFMFKGMNPSGVPLYSGVQGEGYADIRYPEEGDKTSGWGMASRMDYDADRDIMAAFFPAVARKGEGDTSPAQYFMARYDNWSKGNRTSRWKVRAFRPETDPDYFMYEAKLYPYSGYMGMQIAGDYVFFAYLFGEVHVFDLNTGRLVEILALGPEVNGQSAWEDAAMGLRAFKRKNGEYLIFTENSGWGGKDNFFRWRP